MNLLITSVGRRTKLLEYFMNELNEEDRLIAVDCSELAPALYLADKYYIVPQMDSDNYLDELYNICLIEKIDGIISLIDPELSILSKSRNLFTEIGVQLIMPNYYQCELTFDKYKTYLHLNNNHISCAKTYEHYNDFFTDYHLNSIDFPLFVKPRRGSASININKVNSLEEIKYLVNRFPNLIIQEFMDGVEYGADVYVDLITKEIVSIFLKEKISMRAGETDKARSIKDDNLFNLVKEVVELFNLVGPIDIDIFKINNQYFISEINPRFGGGYLIAYECGVNFPKCIINNLKGIENKVDIGNYDSDIYMVKHDDVKIINRSKALSKVGE